MSAADDIVAAARAALGTPFRHQGRIPGVALDCAGLAIISAQAAGIDVIDQSGYPRRAGGAMLEDALDSQPALERVREAPQLGDILLMRFEGDPQHLGICAGKTIIHSWATMRRVVEHDITADWLRRIMRVYRVRADHG